MPANLSRLTSAQQFKLGNWISSNVEELNGKRKQEIAAIATTRLGFTVTEGNVQGSFTVLNESGIRVPSSPSREFTAAGAVGKHVFVARALRDLMVSLGHPVPAYLDACCTNCPTESIAEAYRRDNNLT